MEQPQPLVCPSHKSHYLYVSIITLIIGGSFGAAYGYQKGFDAAKKLVLQSSVGAIMQTPEDVRSFSGVVTGVQGSTITLHVKSTDPFEDPALLNRTVAIASDTKITKVTQKDEKTIQDEMVTFTKASHLSNIAVPPPSPFASGSATVADIVIGANITVVAVENVKTMKAFAATEIRVQQNAAAPILSVPVPIN